MLLISLIKRAMPFAVTAPLRIHHLGANCTLDICRVLWRVHAPAEPAL